MSSDTSRQGLPCNVIDRKCLSEAILRSFFSIWVPCLDENSTDYHCQLGLTPDEMKVSVFTSQSNILWQLGYGLNYEGRSKEIIKWLQCRTSRPTPRVSTEKSIEALCVSPSAAGTAERIILADYPIPIANLLIGAACLGDNIAVCLTLV